MTTLESTRVALHVRADPGFDLDWSDVGRSLPLPAPSTARSQYRLELCVQPGSPGLIDRPEGGITTVHLPDLEFPADDARRLVTALVQRSHTWHGLLGLHATAVTYRGKTFALIGPYGAGKTVTSLRLHELGAELLANDATLLEVSADRGAEVVGGSSPIMLARESIARYFPGWVGAFPATGSGKVDVASLLGVKPLSGAARRLDGFLFVSVRPDGSAEALARREREHRSWICTHLFRASAYHFDRVVASCAFPLTLLESADDVRYRWRCAVELAEKVPCYFASGELEQVVDEALAAIADCGRPEAGASSAASAFTRAACDGAIGAGASTGSAKGAGVWTNAPDIVRRRTLC